MQVPKFPQGWKVFPLRPGTKEPIFNDWPALATDDPFQIALWAEEYPDANWAVAAGPSNLAILDVDGEAGETSLLALEFEYGELPLTREHTTPRGGRHLIFSGDVKPTVGKLMRTDPKESSHLDTRGRHSYIVIPPSTFEGKPYAISHDRPIQNLPNVVRELAGRDREAVAATPGVNLDSRNSVGRAERLLLDYVRSGHVAIEGQGGDDRTYAVCAEVLNLGLSVHRAAELLIKIWNPHCQPPWPEDELETKLENASRYAQNEAGAWAVPPVHERFSAEVLESLAAESSVGVLIRREEPARFAWMDEDEFKDMPPPEWLIQDILVRESIAMLYGPSGSYKTFLALNLAAHIAQTGEATFYVAAEGISRMARQDFPSWKLAHDQEASIPFYMQEDMPVAAFGSEDYDAFANSITKRAAGQKVGLIVLDTLNNAMLGLEENSAKDAATLINAAKALKRTFKCTVLLVHHTPNDGTNPRGSSAFYAAFDTVLRVSSEESSLLARMWVTKQKTSEKPSYPFCYEGRKIGPGLAFLPIDAKAARTLSADADLYGHASIVAALRGLKAQFPDNVVSNVVLSQALTAAVQGETELDRVTAQGRTHRGLLAAAKSGKLDAYRKGEGARSIWGMPEPIKEV